MNDTVSQETASVVRFCLRSWPHAWLKLYLISLTSNPRSSMGYADSFNSDRRPVWVFTRRPVRLLILLTPSLSQSSLVWINRRDITSRENIFVILLTLCLLWCLAGHFVTFFLPETDRSYFDLPGWIVQDGVRPWGSALSERRFYSSYSRPNLRLADSE